MLDSLYHPDCLPPDTGVVVATRALGLFSISGFAGIIAFGATTLLLSLPDIVHTALMS